MRRGVPCVVSLQKPEVKEVIKEVAVSLGSTCFYQEEHWSYWREGQVPSPIFRGSIQLHLNRLFNRVFSTLQGVPQYYENTVEIQLN